MAILRPPFEPPPHNASIADLRKWAESTHRQLEYFINDLINTVNIPIVDSIPTDAPTNQPVIRYYESGGIKRLYIYANGAWSYVTLT